MGCFAAVCFLFASTLLFIAEIKLLGIPLLVLGVLFTNNRYVMCKEERTHRLQGVDWLVPDEQKGGCWSNRIILVIPIIIIIFVYFLFNMHRLSTDPYWGGELAAILIVVLPILVCYCVYNAEREAKKKER